MKIGIVVCTRMDSSRVPNKCAKKINGKSILEHLHTRLKKTGYPIIYAHPVIDDHYYDILFEDFEDSEINRVRGFANDPLKRMYYAADRYKLDAVIRVTHDKIFVDPDVVRDAVKLFESTGLDYLYSDNFTDGTAFEIISTKVLKRATEKYENVERITYAIKQVTSNSINYRINKIKDIRLLIDYPEDIDLMTAIFSCLGNNCTNQQVYDFLRHREDLKSINKQPEITIYTCAYNASKWISMALNSVIEQSIFDKCEYLLIDDHSTDTTPHYMTRLSALKDNVRYIRNDKNLGLSSSSNVAVKNARGKYIIRLDADDYFTSKYAVEQLYEHIKSKELDVVYPSNYLGSFDVIQKGNDHHHVGGAVFKKSSIDFVKFTDDLRHYEGFDLWARTKDLFNIGYYSKPLFFYRQHNESMSKNNLEEREKVKQSILEMHL